MVLQSVCFGIHANECAGGIVTQGMGESACQTIDKL